MIFKLCLLVRGGFVWLVEIIVIIRERKLISLEILFWGKEKREYFLFECAIMC